MSYYVQLTDATAKKALEDILAAGGTTDRHDGTLVETDYGILWLPQQEHGIPCIAVAEGGDAMGWNYAWTTLEDLEEWGDGTTQAQVWASAARSTKRRKVRSYRRPAYDHHVLPL